MLSEVIWHTHAAEEHEETLLCAGDMPIVLTQDGPSFGGFVCPCTITSTELWKMGQVSPNDRVQFKPTSLGKCQGSEVAMLIHDLHTSHRAVWRLESRELMTGNYMGSLDHRISECHVPSDTLVGPDFEWP